MPLMGTMSNRVAQGRDRSALGQDVVSPLTIPLPSSPQESHGYAQHEHRRVLEALRTGDAEAAGVEMERHRANTLRINKDHYWPVQAHPAHVSS